MSNEVEMTQNKMNDVLNGALNNAASIITKDYLERLETYDIQETSTEDKDTDIINCGKFYKLTKLVINKEENFLNKLTTIVNVASSIGCTIATIIKSDGSVIDYYIGIVSKNSRTDNPKDKNRRISDATAFKGALSGNLIGSDFRDVNEEDLSKLKDSIIAKEGRAYASISGIVSLREKDEKELNSYVQGIENLVDSLRGQIYTIIMVADPISTAEIQTKKQGFEMLHSQLSTFEKSSVTINESDSFSVSRARTEAISEGISKGISLTQSKTKSDGNYFGANASAGVSFIVAANAGFNAGVNRSTGYTSGKTETSNDINQRSKSDTETIGTSKTGGKSLQLSYENRSVKSLLDKIDKNLERLDECESFGAFECASYVIADNQNIALSVASNYNALMRGQNSNVQSSHINFWFGCDKTKELGQYLSSFIHPRFLKNDKTIVTPASIVSGKELAIQIGFPKKSVSGITVIPMAPFGRNIIPSSENTLALGKLYHMGNDECTTDYERKVSIDIESLSMHTFITGSTGKGKSTVIYSILNNLIEHKVKGKEENIKFMVIEPAKGEYKDRFGNYDNVKVYGTNSKIMPLLKINPFSFPEDIHVLEHIDRLIEIFNVCWPMYAAMPAVLKESIEKAYIMSGWNLEISECRYKDSKGIPLYPSLIDVLRQITVVMDSSAYSADSKGDYKGALCTRLQSLTNGLYRQILTSDEISMKELFDENVVIDLSRVGSSETKSLIMGLLVMKLQEYRMAEAAEGNVPLKHITVLEEAHNILKRTSIEHSSEGSNMLGKSVEMLSNSIAEMRTYGEGFIIADQAPGLLDMAVIRNTNTKIILGLPDLTDRELVGKAASLNDDQIIELSRLNTFVAAVYQNNWLEPVLCKFEPNFKKEKYKYLAYDSKKIKKNEILEYLLLPISKRNKYDNEKVNVLIDDIFKLPIPVEAKVAFFNYTTAKDKKEIQKLRGMIINKIFNTDLAFELAKSKESSIEEWYKFFTGLIEPSITSMSIEDQKKIVALLAHEKAELDGKTESKEFFERLMSYM